MNVRSRYLLPLVVAAAFVAAGCATSPTVEIMMDPDAPVTDGPGAYGVGTTSTWDHTLNGETVRYTATIVEKRQHNGREVYVNSDSMPGRDPGFPCNGANGSLWDVESDSFVACLKDGEVLASDDPYHGRYNWPLEVGKTWRTEYAWTDNTINPDWSGPSWEEWTVVGWEEVIVPAGTFMAYKIVRTKTPWRTTSEDVAMNWYAPEVPGTVKSVWHRSSWDGYGSAEHMWEMVSYELK